LKAVEANHAKVLRCIQEYSPVYQASIAKVLGLSLMTVNKIVNKLLQGKVIVKSGKTEGKSGRKSELFKFNPDLYNSIGISIGEGEIIISAVDSDCNAIAKREYRLNRYSEKISTSDDIIAIIIKYFRMFVEEFSIEQEKLAVIGIAPEGIIDTERGRCILGTHLGGIIDLNLREQFQGIFHVPIFVDDPARSITYYGNKLGYGSNAANFIYIYLGRGVGSGIVINGQIYRGFRGIAGEIGHIIVDKAGQRCKCGNYGCLETIASEESIIRQMKEGVQEGVITKIVDMCGGNLSLIDLQMLKEAADINDKFSHNILEHVGNHLGKAVALLVNIFNPELILIGGSASILGSYLLESVNRVIKHEALNVINEKTLIKISQYDRFKDSISIALEAFDMLFESTVFLEKLLHRLTI